MWSLGYNQVSNDQESKESAQLLENSPSKSHLAKSNGHFFPENFHSSELFSSTSTKSQSDESSASRLKQSQHSANSESEAETPFFPVEVKETSDKQQLQQQQQQTETNKDELSSSYLSNNNRNEANSETNQPNSNSELDEDFVFVESTQFLSENRAKLKPGHKWKRELIFRSKLTMHTAYDRKDNQEPAAVTAISISKDHRTIYVGDSRGRVYSWICENPGKARADHWIRDEIVETCKLCHVRFTFSERKHHCRDCGGVFCNNCTRFEAEIPRLHINKPVRVCQSCYGQIKADEVLSPVLPS